jgi:hypothetical protein
MEALETPKQSRTTLPPRVRSYFLIVSPPKPTRQSRKVSQCRWVVLIAVLSFLLIQISLNLGIQSGRIPVQDPVFVEKIELYRNWNQVSDSTLSRVVALGSSRTQLAFDAARFGNATNCTAFNFGCSAAGPMTCSLYFRRILEERQPKPDCLFVELHPGFLSPMDPPFESRWLHSYRLRKHEVAILNNNGWQTPAPAHHGWKGWCASSYHFRFALLNRYSPKLLPCPFGLTVGARHDQNGFVGGIDLAAAEKPRAVQMTFEQYSPALKDYSIGGAGPNSIRDILNQAKAHHIRAALVLMPESSEFRSWYGKAGYDSITRAAIEIKAQFAAELFDAREWLSDELIADGHHLTTRGASEFTDRLAVEARNWLK